MPQRNYTSKEQPDTTIALRRSPRLLPKNYTPFENSKTPDPKSRKSHKGSVKKAQTSLGGRSAALNGGFCIRRSPRFSGKRNSPDAVVEKKGPHKSNQCKQVVATIDKRVTRSSSQGKVNECVKKISNRDKCDEFVESGSIEVSDEEDLLGVGRAIVGSNSFKSFGGELEKRRTRASGANKDKCNGFIKSASRGFFDEEDFPDEERTKVGANSSKKFGGELEKRTMRSSGDSPMVIDGGKETDDNEIGVKRKRNEVAEGCGFVKGWSKDQELALQRAYFAAKPTPNFWKKVSKLRVLTTWHTQMALGYTLASGHLKSEVSGRQPPGSMISQEQATPASILPKNQASQQVPGKSANDCFDKVHADHLTPPQPRTRLRPRKINSSSFSLSVSTLLKPAEPKTRRPNARKQRSHLVQKTVRQLLQKHYNVSQSYEADLFSVLESTFNQSTQALQQGVIQSTPECEHGKPGQLKKMPREIFFSPEEACFTTKLLIWGNSCEPTGSETEGQHLPRQPKPSLVKENRKESYIQKTDAIKAAKDALVFDAKDVIHHFHHVKVSAMSNYSDFDDDGVETNDDEFEDEP
ncbi:homeodomain-like superfamily protein [Actinidia rufa]|uniref:Homeodomain-like superfamily protein n=1 Tax=Actinidia rufa TaxID=165716 RepID=A0A7J0H715_9ERIC|nr:homeodomain-like superfamily protein [Actinidia rufa]